MVAKHSSKRASARSNRTRLAATLADSPPQDPAPTPSVIALAPSVVDAVNAERRNLEKAESMLGCLAIALTYGHDGEATEEPDYADAACAIRSLIGLSISRLDPTNLKRAVDQAGAASDRTGHTEAAAS